MSVLSTPQDTRIDGQRSNDALADRRTRSPLRIQDRLFRRAIIATLGRIKHGRLKLTEGPTETVFGSVGEDSEILAASIEVTDARFYRLVATGGSLGAADAYRQGYWTSQDLVAVIRVLARNREALAALGGAAKRLLSAGQRALHLLRRNTRWGSSRNIAAHYDLSNAMFELFLDETMTYSSGIFVSPHATLREASSAKYDRICRTLQLKPSDHVIEIGGGWGGFAEHATTRYGCRVTTTTISAEQRSYAESRFQRAGLTDKITLLGKDYRDLDGQYDKLVSIEMIEAVGHEFLGTYFRKCAELLRPDGAMLLQAITIPDQRYESYRRSVDFIQKYIFPGGCLPSLGAMSRAICRNSDFRITQLNDYGHHYARTLSLWNAAFSANVDKIHEMGMDEVFVRTWKYYFSYCEGAFRENQIGVAQLLLQKPLASLGTVSDHQGY